MLYQRTIRARRLLQKPHQSQKPSSSSSVSFFHFRLGQSARASAIQHKKAARNVRKSPAAAVSQFVPVCPKRCLGGLSLPSP